MQFICETCQANLTIADEKLRGKRLIVRCKRCGVQIRIADPALAAQPQVSPRQRARAIPPPPPTEAAEESAVWFTMVRSVRTGPLTRAQLGARIAGGDLDRGTYVWKDGMEAWLPAHAVGDLAVLFPAPPPPPAADGAPQPDPDAAEPATNPGLPFDSSPQASAESGDGALDLARWGAAELSKPRTDTPAPSITPVPSVMGDWARSPSKTEFRIGQPQRKGPLRFTLLVLGAAVVGLLAAFALFYERRNAAQPAQEVAESSPATSSPVDSQPKAPEQPGTAQAAPEVSAHRTVPSPDVLKKKVEESMPALQGCVDVAMQREPRLRVGKILILTMVAPSGEVTSTRIDKKNVDQSELGACLKSAARSIHFPSFTGEAFPLDTPVVVARGN
jgi:predicted Zn finger-like uncharacterized protein